MLAAEELPDAPLYYNLHDVAKTIRTTAPSADTFRSALVNAGALRALTTSFLELRTLLAV